MTQRPPQALLFDIGGVLVDIDFNRALAAWAPYSSLSPAELRRNFAFDLHYARHERGELAPAVFFEHLARTLALSASEEQIRAGWNAIFVGEIAATRALVEAVRADIPCYAFTNTNATHMPVWSALYPAVFGAFERVFASHEIGLRKPERAAFEHVCRATSLAPESILFFDDLAENIEGAAAAGLGTVWVRSPADVARALDALHLSR